MPVSRKEETGTKPVARHSSDYIAGAGIPIKKRRFPIIRSPSPPPEEPFLLPGENDSPQNKHFSLSNSSVTIISDVSDTNMKTFVSEEKRGGSDINIVNMVPNEVNCSGDIREKSRLKICPGSFDVMDNKDKLVAVAKFAKSETNSGTTELHLGPKRYLPPDTGKEVGSKQKVEDKNLSEMSAIAETTDGSGQTDENIEHISLNLSLSEGKINPTFSNDIRLNLNSSCVHANRSNWDLNTLMDTWDGPVRNPSASESTVNELIATSGTVPLISSSVMVGNVVASERRFHEQSEHRSNVTTSCRPSGQPQNPEDSLQLRISPSFLHSNFSQGPSHSSTEVNVRVVTTGNMVNCRSVKSEPLDDSVRLDFKDPKTEPMGLSVCRTVKQGLVESCSLEALKSSNISAPKLENPRSIKSEPVHQESPKEIEGTSQQSGEYGPQGLDNCYSSVPVTENIPPPIGKSTCSTELTINDLSNHLEDSTNMGSPCPDGELSKKASNSTGQVASETLVHNARESNISGMRDTTVAGTEHLDDSDRCRLKFVRNGDTFVSDEEKVNISGDILEEDSYGSDYESDANHALGMAIHSEEYDVEDDYEDGEVREPLPQTGTESLICKEQELERVGNGATDDKNLSFPESFDECLTSSHVNEEKETDSGDPGKTSNDCFKECVATIDEDKTNEDTNKDASLQESGAIETTTSSADSKNHVKITRNKPLGIVGRTDALRSQETGQPSDQATSESQGTSLAVAQVAEENCKKTDSMEKSDSAVQTREASLNCVVAAKDLNSGGANRSRIINLSRASNSSSPGKTKSFSRRIAGRESSPDVALEGDKLNPRGRDGIYDGSHKFFRESYRDQSSRSSRFNFVRGRGRVSSRSDSHRGPTDFHVLRNKYASGVSDADLDYTSYNTAPDGGFVDNDRGGRKHVTDEGPIFRHIPSQRWSPGGRDGPAARRPQTVHRIGRNISPSRCIGEDGSEFVGLRHSENFMRDFPDDNIDPVFTRRKPPYEGVDFVRGNRNFSSFQRRGLPQMHSKSPIRSRTRSSSPWSSPRRRSQDGFVGHPELPRRRSPAVYRMERMRSPDRPCFPGEILLRRHRSPFFSRPSNESRDMDSGRDHSHPRSVIPNRSPSGRVLIRNTRRFDDGNSEERRFGERRGPIRPFKLPYNGADVENFDLSAEDCRRPYRLCPEDDSDFNERGNLRERELDRRFKNRPGNAPRRMRTIEEQEENFRHGGHVWNDDRFDDMARVKRKRF